jgi:hypothetical protein
VHRDFGYLAIGFTVIYAVSGIAQNHIEDWGDVSFVSSQRTVAIAAIPAATPDAAAIQRVADAAALGTPATSLRAGDEIRLEYKGVEKVTAIAGNVTIQTRERRAFIGVANWLHKARGKKAWKYIADAYALFLLYLAISGIFMIKGKLGFKWRGAALISAGVAVPILYVALAGGPGSQKTTEPDDAPAQSTVTLAPAPAPSPAPPPPAVSPAKCDPFSSMHGCVQDDRKPDIKALPDDDDGQ